MARQPTPPGRPTRLSTERIVAAARGIAEREGLAAVSMRRLGYELDVWPMSLYRHFRDKDELLDAVVDRAAEEVAAPARGSWRSRMLGLLGDTRTMLGSDPEGLRTRFPRALETEGMVKLTEAGIAILEDAGLPSEDAARAWHALFGYAFGAASLGADDAGFEDGLELMLDGVAGRLGVPV
jgi:AcrR family transcriptional regulator